MTLKDKDTEHKPFMHTHLDEKVEALRERYLSLYGNAMPSSVFILDCAVYELLSEWDSLWGYEQARRYMDLARSLHDTVEAMHAAANKIGRIPEARGYLAAIRDIAAEALNEP